ncbi:MAG: DUF6456 domain-containing protein [Pseudodonghicola sp.]
MSGEPVPAVPTWVPESARRYLHHTVAGRPIRDLARRAGCHPSTVLRQIRRIEMRRDDPLVDAALVALAEAHFSPLGRRGADPLHDTDREAAAMTDCSSSPSVAALEREARRVLACLSEAGAVLAVAEQMEKAVVVRGEGSRTAVVGADIAQAMALKDWIACAAPGRISRYRITNAGRAALRRLLAEAENRARADSDGGFSEAQAPYGAAEDDEVEGGLRRSRYGRAESPLALLARRKDRDGQPFLDDGMVRAGERLREDFELAQLGPRVAQNWDRFLTGGARGGGVVDGPPDRGGSAARDRVARALSDLGPGLGDVALRCCCYLEGLEQAERRMGWSARSGKIVLRIALQRLKAHYDRYTAREELIG